MPTPQPVQPAPALVAKMQTFGEDGERYLLLTPAGRSIWVDDPETATAFTSMREAARMAARLPANFRAFGLLRDVELDLRRDH